jgi:hypothetical protein
LNDDHTDELLITNKGILHIARQSGWDERDNQDGDLQSRRIDDHCGGTLMQGLC